MIPATLILLGLLWDFPRDVEPTDFLITLESVEAITGLQRALVAGVAPGTCTEAPGGDADDFCATITCPGPGTFRVTVEARAYGTRSETVQFRVRDRTCTQTEGVIVGPGSLAKLPPVSHCQPTQTPPPPPPVAVTVPTQETRTVEIPQPPPPTPGRPRRIQVVPKQPLPPGTAPQLELTQRQAAVPTAEPPPARTASIPTGPPETVMVAPPPVTPPGVRCP